MFREMIKEIQKHLIPIRPNRNIPRNKNKTEDKYFHNNRRSI
jgi:hypothetical protein